MPPLGRRVRRLVVLTLCLSAVAGALLVISGALRPSTARSLAFERNSFRGWIRQLIQWTYGFRDAAALIDECHDSMPAEPLVAAPAALGLALPGTASATVAAAPREGAEAMMGTSAGQLVVIIPFREREQQLADLLPFLETRLTSDGTLHQIVVVNQVDRWRFNRAALIDVGAWWAKRNGGTYLAMHDVDRLPRNPALRYRHPCRYFLHLSPPWVLNEPYDGYVGGIGLVSLANFEVVDGMATDYWGWGGEDDEFFLRLIHAGIWVLRPAVHPSQRAEAIMHLHDDRIHKRDTTGSPGKPGWPQRIRSSGLSALNFTLQREARRTINGVAFTQLDVELACDPAQTPWCVPPSSGAIGNPGGPS